MDGDTTTQQQPAPQVNILPQPQAPNTAGMTQMGMQGPAPQQGPTFKVGGIPALALGIISAVKQRKQRDLDRQMQHFVGLSAGKDEAEAQAQKADQIIRATMPKIQANPNDQEARAALVQAAQLRQKAQAALQQNKQNLDDLANSPQGAKFLKSLEKAAGIDEKHMNSPERQSLIKAIQKQQNVTAQTAKMMSLMTQRQQLSPEARAQQQMVQGGVMGKPATGGQMLNAQSKNADRVLNAEKMINAVGLNNEKMVEQVRRQSGLVPVRDDKGTIKRNPDGTMQTRNLKPEEMTAEEYARYQDVKAQTDLRTAQAKAAPVKAQAQMMNAQRVRKEHADMATPGYVAAWAKAVQDPTQKVTIAQVPQAARGAVLAAVQASGGKLAIPLGGDEIKRMDLATNAVTNVEEMQKILEEHPELFGPAGWGSSKFEQMLGSDDPMAVNARRFLAAKSLANLPAVGVHGVRGKWALEDLDKLDGNLYQSADSMRGVLEEIHRSASEFKDLADRPASIRGTAGGEAKQAPIYAKNPKTNARVESTDGGKTWHPAQ
jgi:hypothetical protein